MHNSFTTSLFLLRRLFFVSCHCSAEMRCTTLTLRIYFTIKYLQRLIVVLSFHLFVVPFYLAIPVLMVSHYYYYYYYYCCCDYYYYYYYYY